MWYSDHRGEIPDVHSGLALSLKCHLHHLPVPYTETKQGHARVSQLVQTRSHGVPMTLMSSAVRSSSAVGPETLS